MPNHLLEMEIIDAINDRFSTFCTIQVPNTNAGKICDDKNFKMTNGNSK
jgi:hypothetical protein